MEIGSGSSTYQCGMVGDNYEVLPNLVLRSFILFVILILPCLFQLVYNITQLMMLTKFASTEVWLILTLVPLSST